MTGRNTKAYIAGLVGMLVLVAGAYVAIKIYDAHGTSGLKAGDCVRQGDDGWAPAACADAGAKYKIVGFALTTEAKPCREVPGAERIFTADGRVVCIGDKNADPATSVNAARPGDCVTMPDIRTALRRDCDATPTPQFQVLQRLEDVPRDQPGGSCAKVGGSIQAYAINWQGEDAISRATRNDKTDQVVLCLGTNPKSAAAFESQRAARSQCRFITDADLAAAVSSAAGRTYTVKEHREDRSNLMCSYLFTAGQYEVVGIWWEKDKKLATGGNIKPFTLDGLPAYFMPGEGDRYIDVEVNGGVMTIQVQLTAAGDAASKTIAIAVFRALRQNIA